MKDVKCKCGHAKILHNPWKCSVLGCKCEVFKRPAANGDAR